MHQVRIIDSHTGGEHTRVAMNGGPDLGLRPLAERRAKPEREFDRFRSATVTEPRASDVVVGALLVESHDPACAARVIFFNKIGCIGMCGVEGIGLVYAGALGQDWPGDPDIGIPVRNIAVI